MSFKNIVQKAAFGLTTVVAGLLISGGTAHAIPYTGDNTVASPVPAFNVFTGVPAPWGDESDFLRARVPVNGSDSDATTQYVDPLSTTCVNGQKIQMRVYVHNGASASQNNNGTGPSVAHGVKVKVNLDNATAKSTFHPEASISATNAAQVNNNVTINCNGKTVKLKYIDNSASAFSIGTGVVDVDDNALLTTGASIRSQSVPGDVWGCWDERVYVVFSVQVEEVPETPPSLGVCKAVEIVAEDNRKVTVKKITPELTNATVVSTKIDWGDNTTPGTKEGDSHTYAKDGTYTIKVTLRVKLANGTEVDVTSTGCTNQVTFKLSTPPTVTPGTPGKLTNTGPGDIVGIFAATTLAGALLHKFILSRRFNV